MTWIRALGASGRCSDVANESAAWEEELSRYQRELERFLSRVMALKRSLGRALRAGDGDSRLRFLEEAERGASLGIPMFPYASEWRERLEAERREAQLEFKSRLREALSSVEQAIRDETGEDWALTVEGSHPNYTVGGMIRVDARRYKGDVGPALRSVERELRAAVRKRFPSGEAFLECLYVAYCIAAAVDEVRGARTSTYQELRRLHGLMPAAMRELKVRDKGGTYPLLAFGVDLGRCVASGVLGIRGARLELIPTKHGAEGVRVFVPGQPSRVYGKAEFRRGG